MPLRVVIKVGACADCTQAASLIEGIQAEQLLADRDYDSDAIAQKAWQPNMQAVISPSRNRKETRSYDKYLYQMRHLVENAFLHLKRWRKVATRYAKNSASFLAVVQIRYVALWLAIL